MCPALSLFHTVEIIENQISYMVIEQVRNSISKVFQEKWKFLRKPKSHQSTECFKFSNVTPPPTPPRKTLHCVANRAGPL
jgi:hypothetical protein